MSLLRYGMHSNAGVQKESFYNEPQIIVNSAPHFAVGVVVDQAAGTSDSTTGRKIVKAGTPLYGDLDDRIEPFTKTATVISGSGETAIKTKVVGILQHDCDVTVADGNGDLLIIGVVNLDRVDKTTQALITDEIKAALTTVKLIHLD